MPTHHAKEKSFTEIGPVVSIKPILTARSEHISAVRIEERKDSKVNLVYYQLVCYMLGGNRLIVEEHHDKSIIEKQMITFKQTFDLS